MHGRIQTHALRCGLGLMLGVLLSGCLGGAGGGTQRDQQAPRKVTGPVDRAPATNAQDIEQLARLPDPVVKREPRSRGGNREVYTVLGKSYRVMESARGYRQRGNASWYGTKFHGRPTANGERFDIYKLTAAHRHLPIPTYVRVTNLNNGKKTIVRVNDRGPFHADRIIDLSYAAAVKLGFHNQGTAPVLVEVVEPEPLRPKYYLVQAGAFSTLPLADQARNQLQSLTGLTAVVAKTSADGLYRVRLGPVQAGPALDQVEQQLLQSKFGKPRLIPSTCAAAGSRC